MYMLKCKIARLDSAVIFRRFYNPPTKKTWSKQNPLFKTPRPLVEPFNLGRLHPEKEWWNLTKKGLKPDTFMGFPDVANIERHGGSLYTHMMDGTTLSMVIYRCIEKNIKNEEIWTSLTLQALKLAVSLDPHLISLIFLYLSLSSHHDYKFVATFVGRILATLDQFGLAECSNVILAMNNPLYYHEEAFKYVLRHAENLCLAGNLKVEECLKFLTCLKNVEDAPRNCLVPMGEMIEVADLTIVNKTLVFDALDGCCRLQGRVDTLCVTRLFDECCQILDAAKGVNHYFNQVFLNALETYKFKNDRVLHMTLTRIEEDPHECTPEEKCRYFYLLSKMALRAPSDPTLNPAIATKVAKLVAVFKGEAIKGFEELTESDSLSFQLAVALLNSNRNLKPDELKLLENALERVVEKVDGLKRVDLFEMYRTMGNTAVPLDELEHAKPVVVRACWELEGRSLAQECSLLDFKDETFVDSVPKDKLDACFERLLVELSSLDQHTVHNLVRFASRDRDYGERLLQSLKDHRRSLHSPRVVGAIVELYRACGREPDDLVQELLDGLLRARDRMLSADRLQLIETLERNGVDHPFK